MSPSVTPHSYPAGSHITLRLTDGASLSLQVNKPFLPFTKAQVYLVSPSEPIHNLPSQIILKIFDPQTVDDRFPPPKSTLPAHPWTLDAESAAAQYREDVAQGKRPDDFTVDLLYEEEEAEPYLWEERFYRLLKESYESEVDALGRLESFQGTVVPKVFVTGSVIPPPNTRAIQPLGILIEYIPGIPLSDLEPGSGVNIPFEVMRPLLDAVKKFKDIGVFHSDINSHNVLVSPVLEAPERVVLIDFGCAGVREEGCGDEDWEMNCEFFGDERSLRKVLEKTGISVSDYVKPATHAQI
ncbi:hypothetical protein K443DRAFT_675998 [Laccaria amethystina LaAM-08-1]|uniref:Protein kinase domain-containing protein n=1 Tax=Laccaria amethystina LaAM-08-1 TaxID=1095629 RepID=A0A0C9WXC8_9AGAR|nr:hypothetical protein K443DRAFT_675998 [Laccaria amethystina LaAM-08-1]